MDNISSNDGAILIVLNLWGFMLIRPSCSRMWICLWIFDLDLRPRPVAISCRDGAKPLVFIKDWTNSRISSCLFVI